MSRVFLSLGKWLPYANIKCTTIVPSPKVWPIQTCCFAKYLGLLFFRKMVFPSVSVSRPLWLLRLWHKELGSSSQCATTKTFIPLDSCRQRMCACVCLCARVRLKWSASLKWKRGCRGGERAVCSCPDWQNGWGHRWDFFLVDFSSQLAPVCLERHGNLDQNGQASYWAAGENLLSPWIGMWRKWCEECLRRWGQRGGESVAVNLTQWRCEAQTACWGLIWSDCALSLLGELRAAKDVFKPCPLTLGKAP